MNTKNAISIFYPQKRKKNRKNYHLLFLHDCEQPEQPQLQLFPLLRFFIIDTKAAVITAAIIISKIISIDFISTLLSNELKEQRSMQYNTVK